MNPKKLLVLGLPCLAMAALTSCAEREIAGSGGGNTSSGALTSVSYSSGGGGGQQQEEEKYEDIAFNGKLKVYYHNDTANYANKRIWPWANGVAPNTEYLFDNQTDPDDFGVYKIFDLNEGVWEGMVSTTFSFIIKDAGSWSGQSTDTICPFGRFASNIDDTGMMTIYACDGEGGNVDTFTNKKAALGDRVASAYFSDWHTLHVVGGGAQDERDPSLVGKVSSYELYAYDSEYQAMERDEQALAKSRYLVGKSVSTVDSKEFDITLQEEVKPHLAYTLEARMADDPSRIKSKVASFNKLFDTQNFVDKYTYDGNDLGATVVDRNGSRASCVFKLWAPTSSRVQVKVYMGGTPGDLFPTFEPVENFGQEYDMVLGNYGVWQLKVDNLFIGDMNYFYTFLVTNSSGTNEVVDPYATSTGLNGKRACIVDWDNVAKPEGWDNIASHTENNPNGLLTDIDSDNDLSIYEAHIRDLTMDESWGGHEVPGTYKAFVEEGTTYGSGENTVTTGFDHIKEMGVRAIQLLPVFDQDNEERWADENGDLLVYNVDYEKGRIVTPSDYNWGYNPQNYNAIEGSYSTNPADGIEKINEFRNMVQKCADNDIRVIMDVVYNHFASVNGHPLNKVVPGYFLRLTESGSAYDGTGCGNVTATERKMMSKFVVDSVCHWAKNLKIKGFRFDLMGCIDVETMKNVKIALYEIDPDIVVYGEGWAGLGDAGFYDVVNSKEMYKDLRRASLSGIYKYLQNIENAQGVNVGHVGGFSNGFRNGLKGDIENDIYPEWGFLSKGANDVNNNIKKKVGEGMLGANEWGYDDNCWWKDQADHDGCTSGYNNEQTVSYVTCHDNYGLFDQMNYTMKSQHTADVDTANANVLNACVAAEAAALLNQGISFIQGGDEIFRQKVIKSDDTHFAEMVESYGEMPRGDGSYYKVGDGIEMDSGNWLVRNGYKYGDKVNSFKWDRKLTYKGYYEKIKEASLLRNQIVGNILGRPFAEKNNPDINNVFGSTYWDEHGQLVGCYLKGKVDSANYYMLLGGNLASGDALLSSLRSHIDVVYSSTGYHSGSFDMNDDNLGVGKLEFAIVKVSAIA